MVDYDEAGFPEEIPECEDEEFSEEMMSYRAVHDTTGKILPYKAEDIMAEIINRAVKNGFLYNILKEQDTEDILESDRFLECFFKTDYEVIVRTEDYEYSGIDWHKIKIKEYEFPQDYLEQFLD